MDPFPGDEDVEFNSFTRNLLVAVTYFLGLSSASHVLLKRLYRTSDDEAPSQDSYFSLPFLFSTVSLSIALAAMLLLPVTIISHEVLTRYPNNDYIRWLDRDLIFGLWNFIFIGSNFAFLAMLPFAYFYYEADGIGKARGVIARLWEATLVLVLVLFMLAGLIYLAHQLLSSMADPVDYIPFTYSMISSVGALLVLCSMPVGFYRLSSWTYSIKMSFVSQETISARIETLSMDMEVIRSKLQGNIGPPSAEVRNGLEKELADLQHKYETAKEATLYAPVLWNTVFVTMSVVNVVIPGYVALRVVAQILHDLFRGSTGDQLYNYLVFEDALHQPRVLAVWEVASEVTVIIYVIAASLVGVYHLRWMRLSLASIRPRLNGTPMHLLVVNVALIVLLSSSFPVFARLLGLTSFDLMGYYSKTAYLRNKLFRTLYNIAFLVGMSWQYLKILRIRPALAASTASLLAFRPIIRFSEKDKIP
eukprot:TRINITY_DN22534_c0_g1_i1.p1 TRINITY_DN22534_c0_g1~~TRINITY_DN22534_c0_g1_i1.p1  ORF type:complete len:520 (-),score=51.99 TRINITY_DN22534_c0_g1_i1:232-1659(-)